MKRMLGKSRDASLAPDYCGRARGFSSFPGPAPATQAQLPTGDNHGTVWFPLIRIHQGDITNHVTAMRREVLSFGIAAGKDIIPLPLHRGKRHASVLSSKLSWQCVAGMAPRETWKIMNLL
jgi:hypothetical protein